MTPKQEVQRRAIFDLAYHDYAKGLNLYAFFKLSNHWTGEDLVQDTFIKMWGCLAKDGKIDTMKAFLYHVLNNLIVDEYRKRKTTSLDVLLEKGLEPKSGHSENLFDVLDGKMALVTGQSKNALAVQAHRGLEKLKLLYSLS